MDNKERLQPADMTSAMEVVKQHMMFGRKIDINKIDNPRLQADLLIIKVKELSKRDVEND